MSDLRICQRMHWTYPDVVNLPADVYDVLLDELIAEQSDGPDR